MYCLQEHYEEDCRDYLLQTGTLHNDRQYHTAGIMQALLQEETENNMQGDMENNMQEEIENKMQVLVQEKGKKCLVM